MLVMVGSMSREKADDEISPLGSVCNIPSLVESEGPKSSEKFMTYIIILFMH